MYVLLDTDIGSDVDDALALAVIQGSPELELAGVVTVYGDTRVRAQIARRYLSFMVGAEGIPVAAGETKAQSGRPVWWAGHEGSVFSNLESESVEENGVDVLIRAVAAHPGQVDILAIGPLTNIATALDADPAFESNVRNLVIMGGDFRQDRIAEHNIEADIAAAERVFRSALHIVIGGLDLTLKVKLRQAQVEEIRNAGLLGQALAEEIAIWWKFIEESENSPHDPILALWIARPDLFSSTRAQVEVSRQGRTFAELDPDGRVSILDIQDPSAIRDEIVRRVVAAALAQRRD